MVVNLCPFLLNQTHNVTSGDLSANYILVCGLADKNQIFSVDHSLQTFILAVSCSVNLLG